MIALISASFSWTLKAIGPNKLVLCLNRVIIFELGYRSDKMILHTNVMRDGNPLVLVHSGGMTGLTEYEEQADLKAPTLCIVGEQQELEVFATVTYKQLNPHINISVVPFAGHLAHRDQPELYSRTLHTFIESREMIGGNGD